MYEEEIINIPDFLSKLHFYSSPYWVFRGHANLDWDLIPAAGRPEYTSEASRAKRKKKDHPPLDLSRFKHWSELAVAYGTKLPDNEFECLALAQHYGLATRLLDWSTNPLVALFFAVESCTESDACVYAYTPDRGIDSSIASVSELNYVALYTPPPFDNRILAQQGVFSFHPWPHIELASEELWRYERAKSLFSRHELD